MATNDGIEGAGAVGVEAIAVDCADPERLGGWWGRLLRGTVAIDAEGDARLTLAQGLRIDFLRVPEPKRGKNRLHLDLHSQDFGAAVARAIELGARPAPDVYEGDDWQVLRDPEGNEFCILRPPPGP